LAKLNGDSVLKAEGVSTGGTLQVMIAGWGLNLGAETGIYFFPDTCEIAVYSIKAGVVKKLDPNGGPATIAFENGVNIGLSAQFEAAELVGKGPASADSFAGNFYTVQGGFKIVGGSIYKGDSGPGGTWYGGTGGVGVGPVPIQVGTIVWNYQLIKSIKLDKDPGLIGTVGWCYCLELALLM